MVREKNRAFYEEKENNVPILVRYCVMRTLSLFCVPLFFW